MVSQTGRVLEVATSQRVRERRRESSEGERTAGECTLQPSRTMVKLLVNASGKKTPSNTAANVTLLYSYWIKRLLISCILWKSMFLGLWREHAGQFLTWCIVYFCWYEYL